MRLSNHPLTAIERARIAYELMLARQRAVAEARRARERSRTVKLVVCLATTFLVLIGTAIYQGWLPTSMRSSILSFRTQNGDAFSETRTGQVRSFVRDNTCQELQFNNDRGVYVDGSLVPCRVEVQRDTPPAPPASGSDRFNAIRDAFTAR